MAQRAIPVYVGLAVVVAIAFGPGGTSAGELVRALDHTPAARIGALVAWAALLAPTARSVASAAPAYLRTVPMNGAWGAATFAALHAVFNVGWALLWMRAEGLASAVVAVTFTAAIHACIAAPRIDVRAAVGAAALVIVWGARMRGALGAALAIAVLALAESYAWRHFAERAEGTTRSWVAGRAPFAVARAHVAYLWRVERTVVGRAALGLVTTGCGGGLIARNNDPRSFTEAAWLVLATSILPLLLLSRGLVAGVLRSEQSLESLFRTSNTSRTVWSAGNVLAVASLGAISGALVGAVSLLFVKELCANAPLWAPTMTVWGAACACTVAAVSRAAKAERRGSAARPLVFLTFGILTLLLVAARSIAIGVGLYIACAIVSAVLVGRMPIPVPSAVRRV